MGHYAAEMQCQTCGLLRCECPAKPDETAKHWVVNDEFKVMRAKDYEKSIGTMGFYRRMLKPHFKKKSDATVHAVSQQQRAIVEAKQQLNYLEKQFYPQNPTTQELISMYEGLLHDIQMFSAVTLNHEAVSKLISNINSWSYAHRAGNGEINEEDQQEVINIAFRNLRKR